MLSRFFVLSLYITALILGVILFHVSQKVQDARYELAVAENTIEKQQQSIQVLRAEWDYLNNPARLDYLSRKYLGFDGPKSDQVITSFDHIPSFIPSLYPSVKPSVFAPAVKSDISTNGSDVLLDPFSKNNTDSLNSQNTTEGSY